MDVKAYFLNGMIEEEGYGTKGAINMQYVSMDEQVIDVMAKPLSRVKFEYFCDKLGVV